MRGSVLPLLQVPDWFLNRQRDFRDGKTSQIVSSTVDSKLREDFERLKKIRSVAVQLLCLYQNLCFVVWTLHGSIMGKFREQGVGQHIARACKSCITAVGASQPHTALSSAVDAAASCLLQGLPLPAAQY